MPASAQGCSSSQFPAIEQVIAPDWAHCIHLRSENLKVKVTQWCPTLCNSMDYTVHGILQARILEWVAFSFSRGSSQPKDQTQISRIAGGFFTSWATTEAWEYWGRLAFPFSSRYSQPRSWTGVSCIAWKLWLTLFSWAPKSLQMVTESEVP